MKVAVSGANGFVGRALASYCQTNSANEVLGLQRRHEILAFPSVVVPSLSDEGLLAKLLARQDVVVHCAAAVHKHGVSPQIMHEINVELTLSLARAAVRAGCRRFVFVSSIGVNGSFTLTRPFSESDPPRPIGPYAASKWAAEQGLLALSANTGLELVIVRPPLVYGWGAPGNFATLSSWIARGRPLPFAHATSNRRSYIGVANLAHFLTLCAVHPQAAGQTFLVSDDEAISTAELVKNVATAMGLKPRLWPIPLSWIHVLALALGRQDMAHRLFGNLEVDASKARRMLDWRPPLSMVEQLNKISKY